MNKIMIYILTFLVLSSFAFALASDDSRIKHWWKPNVASGNICDEIIGCDASITPIGTPDYQKSCFTPNCVQGTDYSIYVANNEGFKSSETIITNGYFFAPENTSYCYSFWANITGTSNDRRLFDTGAGDDKVTMYSVSGDVNTITHKTDTITTEVNTNVVTVKNTPHLLTWCWNGTNVKLYLNGTKRYTDAMTRLTETDAMGFAFYWLGFTSADGYQGRMEDIALFIKSTDTDVHGDVFDDAEHTDLYTNWIETPPGVPEVPVFVNPTPADNEVNNTNQTFNVTHTGSDVQFFLWLNESLHVNNVTGTSFSGGLYFNWTTNLTDGSYYIEVGVQNITSGLFSNNISRTFGLGSVPPTITLNTNNLFASTNDTVVYSDYGWINITLIDDTNLDSFLINITDKNGIVMFNFTNASLTGYTTYNFQHNLSTLLFVNGTYFVNIFGSDTHTVTSIDDYIVTTENRKLSYRTAEGNDIEISVNENAITKTTKYKDRYDFEFDFVDKQTKQREFIIKSNNRIKYLPNSIYKAHFTIMNFNTKMGNWVDFEGIAEEPTVIKVSDYEYKIIFNNVPSKIKFESIGGLNTVHKSYQFDFFTAERTTLIGRDVLTDLYVTKLNYTITDLTRGNVSSYYIGDNTTLNLSGLRQGIYNVSIVHLDSEYATLNTAFEITTNSIETFIFDLSVVATINLFDEATGGYFNVSSADDIEMHVFCPNQTVTTDLTANISEVPITCEYTKLRFIVEYGVDTYFRTLIIPFTEATNISVYLINLDTTTSILNSMLLDDLFQTYDNPSIYIYRLITGGQRLITSDFVDIENKIAAYLIENAEYNIVVKSDNQPDFVFGSYVAAEAGDIALRLYDFDVTPQPSGWSSDVVYSTQIMNITGDDAMGNRTLVTFYNDSGSGTTNLVWTVYEDDIGGNVLATSTSADTSDATFIYYISPVYNTTPLAVELIVTHDSGEHTSRWILQEITEIILGIERYINVQFLNWFITILLALIAIMSTIRTSDMITFVILGLAAVFIMFGWYKVSWAILVLCIIVSLIFFLKKQSDRPVGLT